MIHVNHHVKIAGTGSYVPNRVIENGLLRHVSNDEWVKNNLGIERRHVAYKSEYSSHLAFQAAQEALDNAKLRPNDLDLIIMATSTPDRKAPSTACLLQKLLEIENNCPAFDVQAVCSGFLYSLTIGSQFISSGDCQNVLVVGADTFSKITNWDHRDCVFFGDGAGAAVLQRASEPGLFSTMLYADGRGQNNFTVYPGEDYFTMNGRAVYETGTTVLPESIKALLSRYNLSVKDVDHIIPHQPSIRLLKKTAEILDIPFGKVHTNMKNYANTAGATIPLLLDEVNRAGKLKPNDLIVFAAVGSGWAWGAGLYRWQ